MNVEQEINTIKKKLGTLGQGKIYQIKAGMKERRDLNEHSSTGEVLTVLATLIKDLKTLGVLK